MQLQHPWGGCSGRGAVDHIWSILIVFGRFRLQATLHANVGMFNCPCRINFLSVIVHVFIFVCMYACMYVASSMLARKLRSESCGPNAAVPKAATKPFLIRWGPECWAIFVSFVVCFLTRPSKALMICLCLLLLVFGCYYACLSLVFIQVL